MEGLNNSSLRLRVRVQRHARSRSEEAKGASASGQNSNFGSSDGAFFDFLSFICSDRWWLASTDTHTRFPHTLNGRLTALAMDRRRHYCSDGDDNDERSSGTSDSDRSERDEYDDRDDEWPPYQSEEEAEDRHEDPEDCEDDPFSSASSGAHRFQHQHGNTKHANNSCHV